MNTWVGIDVSCKTLDCAWFDDGKKKHIKVNNDLNGFKRIYEESPKDAAFVMEATGSYYLNVALFLDEKQRYVSVVNPLRVNGFMKADLCRSKSDKADALAIARFGAEKQPTAWKAPTKEMAEMQQLRTLADKLASQIVQLTNEEHAFTQSVLASLDAVLSIRYAVRALKEEKERVEVRLDEIAEKTFPKEVELITTITGVGRATAIRVIATIGDFTRFQSCRQLVSFLGLSPTLKQSGTSLHSRGHISRLGGPRIRSALYFCAIAASRFNAQCKQMWDRMTEKNKPGKVILMAIENKLIRQMYAVVISNKPYDPHFAEIQLAF